MAFSPPKLDDEAARAETYGIGYRDGGQTVAGTIQHDERISSIPGSQYKAVTSLLTRKGTHHHVSKKEFCRLIKGATLLAQADVRKIWLE